MKDAIPALLFGAILGAFLALDGCAEHAPYDRPRAEALFRACLAAHPDTADVVIVAQSPVTACLDAARELTSTTSTRSR